MMIEHSIMWIAGGIPGNTHSGLSIGNRSYIFIACFAVIALLCVLSVYARVRKRMKTHRDICVDALTGGNTQAYFEVIMRKHLRQSPLGYAFIQTDIIKFKLICEHKGCDVGDATLKRLYRVLNKALAKDEALCRIGTDHLGMLVRCSDEAALCALLQRYAGILQDNKLVEEKALALDTLKINFSVCFLSRNEQDLEVLIEHARLACSIGSCVAVTNEVAYSIYSQALRQQFLRGKNLEQRAHIAMQNGEFCLFLQPKVDLSKNEVGGAEALVRWQGPDGMIYPNEFIPLFERNGFIAQLDFYMLHQVCALQEERQKQGLPLFPISINLSPANFTRPGFFDDYEALLNKCTFPLWFIEFEFIESLVFEYIELMKELICRIHALGATCAIDDYTNEYLDFRRHSPVH